MYNFLLLLRWLLLTWLLLRWLLLGWLLLEWLVLTQVFAKLPWEKLDAYPSFFFLFWPLPHVTSTPPWLLRPVRVSTSSELYPNTWLFDCLGIQFFNSLTCDLRDTMPRQRSPTFIPREAKDFPRGDNYSKHVPLSTYLA